MVQPYYKDEKVTLYWGDCREVADWRTADVLVTDPPYGMTYDGGKNHGRGRRSASDGRPRRERIPGDDSAALRDEILGIWGDRPALVFGTWRVTRPSPTRQLLVWDKSDAGPGMG